MLKFKIDGVEQRIANLISCKNNTIKANYRDYSLTVIQRTTSSYQIHAIKKGIVKVDRVLNVANLYTALRRLVKLLV